MAGAPQFPVDAREFAGKRVLITGGTKGTGKAIARRLAAAGATVATTARSPLPDGQYPDVFVDADVSTAEGVERVVRAVAERLGAVDLLVDNVGGSSALSGGFALLNDENWYGHDRAKVRRHHPYLFDSAPHAAV